MYIQFILNIKLQNKRLTAKLHTLADMKKVIFLFLVYLFLWTSISTAQDENLSYSFNVSEASNLVYVRCVLSAGYTCNGILLERSPDSIFFDQIGEIPGICGDANFAISYEFIDEKPIRNAESFYRLELGGYGYTHVVKIKLIDLGANTIQLRPNPSQNTSTLYIKNRKKHTHQIEVFNLLGSLVYTFNTQNEELTFYTDTWLRGIYIIKVYNTQTGDLQSAKLIVN